MSASSQIGVGRGESSASRTADQSGSHGAPPPMLHILKDEMGRSQFSMGLGWVPLTQLAGLKVIFLLAPFAALLNRHPRDATCSI